MGEKAKNFRGSTRKLLSYLKPFHWAIIMVLLCAAVSAVFTIVGPKVLAKATDELAKGIMAVVTGGDGVIDFAGTLSAQRPIFLYPGIYHGRHFRQSILSSAPTDHSKDQPSAIGLLP